MKRFTTTIIIATLAQFAFSQNAVQVVRSYGDNLSAWVRSGDVEYRENIIKLCSKDKKQAVFKDKLTYKLAEENHYGHDKYYQLRSFINWIEKKTGKGASIVLTNIKEEDDDNVVVTTSANIYSNGVKDNLELVSCDVTMSGLDNYKGKQLIYIWKGIIAKVDDYEVIVTSSGKKKVKVDFSDIMDEYATLGATYNYGKNWPIGLSVNYSYSMFMIGLDVGVNTDKDKLYKHSLEMTDVMNYTKEDVEYDPKFFATLTPSLYLKYFSVGCGAGIMYMSGKKKTAQSTTKTTESNGSNSSFAYTIGGSHMTEEDCSKVKFMLRPSVKGFIPITDEMFLSLSVGYDYVFGYKEKNGFNFGVGLQFELDW